MNFRRALSSFSDEPMSLGYLQLLVHCSYERRLKPAAAVAEFWPGLWLGAWVLTRLSRHVRGSRCWRCKTPAPLLL